MAATTTAITLSTGYCSLQRSSPCKTPTPVIRSHGLTLSSRYTLGKIALAGFGLLSADVVYAYWYEKDRDKRIDAVLEKTGRDRCNPWEDLYSYTLEQSMIDRPDVEKMVESVIKSPPTKYDVIVGNHGTGKSTLVYRLACRLPGIVYVTIPPALSPAMSDTTPEHNARLVFARALKAALDWKVPGHSWSRVLLGKVVKTLAPCKHAPLCLFCFHADGFCQASLAGEDGYLPMMEDFRRATARYMMKHKVYAVIIIDNTNVIAEKDPELLYMLQLEAKMAADIGLYKTIFVTSDGKAPEMMKSELQQAAASRDVLIIRADRSAWSRGSDRCRIGDLTASEATKYIEKRGISQHADKLTHSCGTRILTLKDACDQILRGVEIDGSFPILVFARPRRSNSFRIDQNHEDGGAGKLQAGYREDGSPEGIQGCRISPNTWFSRQQRLFQAVWTRQGR